MPKEGGLKQFLAGATVILSNNICNENMLHTINYYLGIMQASLDSAFGLFYQVYTLSFDCCLCLRCCPTPGAPSGTRHLA